MSNSLRKGSKNIVLLSSATVLALYGTAANAEFAAKEGGPEPGVEVRCALGTCGNPLVTGEVANDGWVRETTSSTSDKVIFECHSTNQYVKLEARDNSGWVDMGTKYCPNLNTTTLPFEFTW